MTMFHPMMSVLNLKGLLVLFATTTIMTSMTTTFVQGNYNTAGEGTTSVVTPPNITLRDGSTIPQIGIGVYRAKPGRETYTTVQWALEVGYRHIDTAQMYQNEQDVGQALRDSGIPREQLYITTKLNTQNHGYYETITAIDESLSKLQTEYIDLVLIHSPFGGKLIETWDALVQLQKGDGKIKSIGVSNFGIQHLQILKDYGRPIPVINQIELHPLIYQERKKLVYYCQQNLIRVTAYGSLFSGDVERYNDSMLQYLSRKYRKTVPQILLRWAIDHNMIIIPKSSSSKERLQENFDVLDFKLEPNEIQVVDDMPGPPLDEYWDPVNDAQVDIGETKYGNNMKFMNDEL